MSICLIHPIFVNHETYIFSQFDPLSKLYHNYTNLEWISIDTITDK